MEQTRTETGDSFTDADLRRRIEKDSEQPVTPDRADRFYDRVRGSIQEYIDRKGGVLGKTAEFLLLVPDIFMLLWRLTTDSRVTGKDKVLLGSAVVYFILPFDLIPEAVVGPIGYLDDLVFAVYVLNTILRDTDPEVLREHWTGSEDVLVTIQRVLTAADTLVATNILGRIKKMIKK
ncbi:MAG TPA: DUF1232 domain-containing protein [Thermoanaerobaculia bacterium]